MNVKANCKSLIIIHFEKNKKRPIFLLNMSKKVVYLLSLNRERIEQNKLVQKLK